MGWKNWALSNKRAIFVTIFIIIWVTVLTFINDDFVGILAMPIFIVGFGIAASGDMGIFDYILVVFSVLVTIFLYFLIAKFLTSVYEKIKYKKTAIILFIITLILVSGLLININKYPTYGTISDCEKISDAWYSSHNDYKPRCYQVIAEKMRDASICDNIVSDDDFKWFCYEEVAHRTNDPSICASIPEKTFNAYVETKRRDRCYSWFNMCDKITGNSDGCFERKARVENNIKLCDNIERESTKNRCLKKFQ